MKEGNSHKKYRFGDLSNSHTCRFQTLGKLCTAREEFEINVTALDGFLLLIYEVIEVGRFHPLIGHKGP
jgi:hypothetical protein